MNMAASNFQFLLKPQQRKTDALIPFYKTCCLIIMNFHLSHIWFITLVHYDLIDFSPFFWHCVQSPARKLLSQTLDSWNNMVTFFQNKDSPSTSQAVILDGTWVSCWLCLEELCYFFKLCSLCYILLLSVSSLMIISSSLPYTTLHYGVRCFILFRKCLHVAAGTDGILGFIIWLSFYL